MSYYSRAGAGRHRGAQPPAPPPPPPSSSQTYSSSARSGGGGGGVGGGGVGGGGAGGGGGGSQTSLAVKLMQVAGEFELERKRERQRWEGKVGELRRQLQSLEDAYTRKGHQVESLVTKLQAVTEELERRNSAQVCVCVAMFLFIFTVFVGGLHQL